MRFKEGDKVIVIKNSEFWKDYALVGWKGTIVKYFPEWKQYQIKWIEQKHSGNLVWENQLKLLEDKKVEYLGIVKFCRQHYK